MSLLFPCSTRALNTKVETIKGVVTLLYGKAKNAAEKDRVAKLVSDILLIVVLIVVVVSMFQGRRSA